MGKAHRQAGKGVRAESETRSFGKGTLEGMTRGGVRSPPALLDAIEEAWLGGAEPTSTASWDVGEFLGESSLPPSTSSSAWSDASTSIAEIRRSLSAFNRARDWERFHTPAALVQALIVEAAELLELFLWTGETPGSRPAPGQERVEEEAADVAICLMNLCNRLGIDLASAVERKVKANAEKYPITHSKARALKYSEFSADKTQASSSVSVRPGHNEGVGLEVSEERDDIDPSEATLSALDRTPVRRRR